MKYAFFASLDEIMAYSFQKLEYPLFIFSVLNTDNMSLLGLTIDYGPFGFIDRFQADYICNGSGR